MTEIATPVDPAQLQFPMPYRLRLALELSGVERVDMADYLGVRREAVSTWLSGKVHPKKSTLRLWAFRTGVPLEWLETGQVPGHLDGGPGPGSELPRLDSNQQPSGYQSRQVRTVLQLPGRPRIVRHLERAA